MTRLAPIGLGLSLVLASCTAPVTDPGTRRTSGEYLIFAGDKVYVGTTVSTNWDPDVGLIYLGPDETIEPVLSLNITLDPQTAYMTTADVKVGTGEELNGRSYTGIAGGPWFTSVSTGSNYITVALDLKMERVLFRPEDVPEVIEVSGTFTAVSK